MAGGEARIAARIHALMAATPLPLPQIKARSHTLQRCVLDTPGGLACMHLLGWRSRVADHERQWVVEGEPGTLEWRVLQVGLPSDPPVSTDS